MITVPVAKCIACFLIGVLAVIFANILSRRYGLDPYFMALAIGYVTSYFICYYVFPKQFK